MNKKIVLASSSPRRKDILEQMGLDFKIISSTFEENIEDLTFKYETIENLAYEKAFCVAKNLDEEFLVIGADTVVVLDGKILGKPKDFEHAKEMLKNLSGKTHFVVTSICIINSNSFEQKISSTTSHVEFKKLSDKILEDYLLEFRPYDKAGAYGIQELPDGFIENVSGSFENIIGLCPISLEKLLREFDTVV